VKTTQAELQQMFDTEQKLASAVNSSSTAVLQAKSVQEQIDKLKATGAVADSLKAFNTKLSSLLEGPENLPANTSKPPSLSEANENAYSLYKMVGQVDAAPTPVQVAQANKVESELTGLLRQWNQIVSSDLPAINAQLKQAGLSEINPQQKPEHGENQGNEE
jgi:hypothetical protein